MAPSEKPPHPPFYLLPNPKPPKIQAGPGISTFPEAVEDIYWITPGGGPDQEESLPPLEGLLLGVSLV